MAKDKKTVKNGEKLPGKHPTIRFLIFAPFFFGAVIIHTFPFPLFPDVFKPPSSGASYLPALILPVLYNSPVNRRYTFKSANNVPVAMLKVAIYYCIFTPLSTYLGNLAEGAGVNEYVVLAVTLA